MVEETLDARLRAVEDRFAIAELRARYCHLLDDQEWDGFIDLFVPDGRFVGLETVEGHAALREFFPRFARATPDFWHFCCNETVTLAGDEARGRVTLQYLSGSDGTSFVSAGHYDDVMRKDGGRWRFVSRTITFYYLAPLSQAWAGRPLPEGLRRPG